MTVLNKVRDFLKSLDKNRILMSAALFLLTFLMLAAFWNQPCFISDEAEIFMHGDAIANGLLLYRDTASQHMPLMYYLAALFSLLGANSIISFRLWFYGFMALLFAVIYYVYSKRNSKVGLFLFPIMFIVLMTDISWRASIMSDQFQGIGMAILFLEFLEFTKDRRLGLRSCIMISLAIFLSFGSAFVAAFAIIIMALTVISFDIFCTVKEGVEDKKACALSLLRKYGILVGIVLAPFVVLMFIYLVTGTLDDFFNWAYKINVTVYSNYIDGYGTSITSGLFGGFKYIFGFFSGLSLDGFGVTVFIRLLVFLLVIAFLCKLAVSGTGSLIKVVGSVLFIGACATRELFSYHGTPALCVLALISALFIGESAGALFKKGTLTSAVCALLAVVVLSPYLTNIAPNLTKLTDEASVNAFESNATAECVDKLTEDGERVGFSTLDCDVMVMAGVIPASLHAGSVPWFWDFASEEALAQLTEAPPRVFVYDENHHVWGNSMRYYAPDLVRFVQENYTKVESKVWVHNSYYEEAMAKLAASG